MVEQFGVKANPLFVLKWLVTGQSHITAVRWVSQHS
jgi:hypothetical protein